MLRILGGESKGRKLKGPGKLNFRPATGRVKEFIFAILGPHIEHAVVLDLFSGSGSIGIEALSRGADRVIMVEQSANHIRIIKHNLEICRYGDRAEIIKGDVFRTLKFYGTQKDHFDIIFADPPFNKMLRSEIVEHVERNRLLASEGRLIIEHQADDREGSIDHYQLIRQKRFGHCMVSIYG